MYGDYDSFVHRSGLRSVVTCVCVCALQGFARMTSAVCLESCQDGTGLDGVFSVEWLRRDLLPIQRSQHLLSQSSVDQLRDGQVRHTAWGGGARL